MSKAKEIPIKHPSETKTAGVSFVNVLESGESLTGTPTVTSSPSGLTITNIQRNATAITINGASVAANKAVLFTVSGGKHGVQYELEVQCNTNGTPAQSPLVECKLLVQDG
jgi:hypothetical protein